MNHAKHAADSEQDKGNLAMMANLAQYRSRPTDGATWLGSILMVEEIGMFPSSGDIHRPISDPTPLLSHLKNLYGPQALDVDEGHGLTVMFKNWRFRVRVPASEPAIIINVETRGDSHLMALKTAELLAQLERFENDLR